MRRSLVLAALVLPILALGHVSVLSVPGLANTTQEITFGVGHGCAGNDTSSVRIAIPAGVTSVRTLSSDFGASTVEQDPTGATTAVMWQRDPAHRLPVDTNFYKLTVRMKLPNTPFQVLYFPSEQRCFAADGGTLITYWTNTSGMPPDAGEPEPAPAVVIVPPHKTGWNKMTVPVVVDNLGLFFSDAQIVWKGNAAFSPNSSVTSLIAATEGVTALTGLQANDEIWVKY